MKLYCCSLIFSSLLKLPSPTLSLVALITWLSCWHLNAGPEWAKCLRQVRYQKAASCFECARWTFRDTATSRELYRPLGIHRCCHWICKQMHRRCDCHQNCQDTWWQATADNWGLFTTEDQSYHLETAQPIAYEEATENKHYVKNCQIILQTTRTRSACGCVPDSRRL